MRGWKFAPLRTVAAIERNTVEASAVDDGVLYVGLEHIQSGGEIVAAQAVKRGELASSKFAFTAKHVLYGKLRPYLAKIARPEFDGVCSTDILPVLPGPDVDRNYLTHFLLTPEMVALASTRATGANLPRLSPKVLSEFRIPLPPLVEQQRIADVLDRVEALRAKRRAVLVQLDALVQAIFLDMFGDPASNPRGWTRQRLGTLLTSGPQNGLYKPASEYGFGTPILRIDSFYAGVTTNLGALKRVRISESERKRFALRTGDVIINRVNSREYLGKSAVIPTLRESTVFESNMMRIRLDRDQVEPVYVIRFLQSSFIKQQIMKAAKHAVNQSSINQQDVRSFLINVPPVERQQEFSRRLVVVEALRAQQRAALVELDALFASLQHRAFRGEL